MDGRKRCARCKKLKLVSDFYRNRSRKDGLQHTCKQCRKAFKAGYYRNVETQRQVVAGKKVCRTCGEMKPLDEYLRQPTNRDGRRSDCKACSIARRREYELRRRYGLTNLAWEAMFEGQGRACAICRDGSESMGWNVDHDHKSGKVRGILCGRCNTALGLLRDSPDLCIDAAMYLERSVGA